MKKQLLMIAVMVGVVLALVMLSFDISFAQAPPPPPAPPSQTPVWAPAILLTLGASFFAFNIMRRK